MREFNPQLWFSKRKLVLIPKHFVRASTPLTEESTIWIEDKLIGRYAISNESSRLADTATLNNILTFINSDIIYFEDPKELTLYELYWAGRNNFSN
jgi:hypothetical protein